MSRGELEAFSARQTEAPARAPHHSSAYYRARMDTARVDPDKIAFALPDFCASFPTSTKAEFLADQERAPAFRRALEHSREDVALVNMTGGTSGQGQEIYGRSQRDVHTQATCTPCRGSLQDCAPATSHSTACRRADLTTGGWGPGEGLRIIGTTAFHVGGTLSTDAKIDLMLRGRRTSTSSTRRPITCIR